MTKNLLFIWIPKCAGTSIFDALEKHGCRKLKTKKDAFTFDNNGWVTFGHLSTNLLIEKGVISRDFLNSAYKFCIVRNPWDRMVSLYKYRKLDTKMTFSEFVAMVDKSFKLRNSLFGKFLSIVYSFSTYRYSILKIILDKLNEYKIPVPLPKPGFFNIRGLSQANPQTEWILDNKGNLLVDKICKMENLEKDFQEVCSLISIDEKLPFKNKTDHKDYKEYYDENTKGLVAEIYKKDIDTFGYEF